MPDVNVTSTIHAFMQATDAAAARTALGAAASVHTHAIADITGLQTALDDKASKTAVNSFSAAQGISASTSGAVLAVAQTSGSGAAITATQNSTGTGSALVVLMHNTASTAPAARITNTGSGHSLLVEDSANPDTSPFVISATGRVGVGVAPDANAAVALDAGGILFSDGTRQTSAGAGVHTHTIADVTGLQTALDGKAASVHTHTIADVTGLQSALDGKATSVHTHTIADVTGLQSALDGKATSVHTHAIADVTGLQSALDGKATSVHTHAIADVTGLQTALDGKAASVHTHAIADVTGLQTALDGRVNKAGDTMTGKLSLALSGGNAPLNIPIGNPTPVAGDVWISTGNVFSWRGSNNATYPAASTVLVNAFTKEQSVSANLPGVVLSVANAGTGSAATFTAQGTSAAVRITQTGSGEALRVEDESPESTPFVVDGAGRVGVGVAPDATAAVSLDAGGIKFSDGSRQTTAGAASVHTHAIADVTGLQTALDGKAASTHTHTISDVTNLQTALDGKAASTHTHTISDVTNLQTALDGKAASTHTHAISDVTNLQTALDGKAASTHTHAISDVTNLQTTLDGKAASTHTHTIANVTGLQTALDGKAASTHTHVIGDVTGLQTALDAKQAAGSYAASVHTHTASQISDFLESVDDRVSTLLVPGDNITLTYNDVANTLTIAAANGAGGGGGGGGTGESFAVVPMAFMTPGNAQFAATPTGYKYVDIYASSGGSGGGGGGDSTHTTQQACSGGGGAPGLSMRLLRVPCEGAVFNIDVGAGGAGGLGDSAYNAQPGTAGGAGMPTAVMMTSSLGNVQLVDLAKYTRQNALTYGGGNPGVSSQAFSAGGSCNYYPIWFHTVTNGQNGTSGEPPVGCNLALSNGTPITLGGSAGGGFDGTFTPHNGGNISDYIFPNIDPNLGSLLSLNGLASPSGTRTQDALPVPYTSGNDIYLMNFLGGAGGAGASSSNCIDDNGVGRAGNGAAGGPGCGGGGGGAIGGFNTTAPFKGGNGGSGGDGFVIMFFYK